MAAVEQLFKLLHTIVDIVGQIRVDVVVINNSIWRARLALDDGWMLAWNAVSGIVGCVGVAYQACIPHVRITLGTQAMQQIVRKEAHLARAVFGNRASWLAAIGAIAEKAGEYLIDYYLFIHNYEG